MTSPRTIRLALFAAVAAAMLRSAPQSAAEPVHVIDLDDKIISPVTQSYITDAITRAEQLNAECLVIQLDTPGGLLESTRQIVKAMLNARVPILVYVAPSGSRAGSAGVFITLAAHIAAMAPSTNIGAAHPVTIGSPSGDPFQKKDESDKAGEENSGKSKKKREAREDAESRDDTADEDGSTTPAKSAGAKEEEREADPANPLAEKILNDTRAWVRAIAKARGRNAEWAEKAVTQSVSITDDEALQNEVIDLIAEDLTDLLEKVDGRTVRVLGNDITLHTADAEVLRFPMTSLQRFLAIITHPNVAYLLMMLGTLGLIFEFTHPGIGFPGVAGTICILLALYAFQILPVNYVAVALLALGVILLVAEVKLTSYGLLALGGMICLVLGGVLLIQSPDPALRVSMSVILPTVVTMAGITLFLVHRVVKSHQIPVATGNQGMVGAVGEATSDLNPEGFVFVHGETWSASCAVPAPRGARVKVLRISGLHLEVEPIDFHPTANEGEHP